MLTLQTTTVSTHQGTGSDIRMRNDSAQSIQCMAHVGDCKSLHDNDIPSSAFLMFCVKEGLCTLLYTKTPMNILSNIILHNTPQESRTDGCSFPHMQHLMLTAYWAAWGQWMQCTDCGMHHHTITAVHVTHMWPLYSMWLTNPAWRFICCIIWIDYVQLLILSVSSLVGSLRQCIHFIDSTSLISGSRRQQTELCALHCCR